MFVVVKGKGSLLVEGEGSIDLKAGTVGVIRRGSKTTWIIHETLLKAYELNKGPSTTQSKL
jgi:uncharacterized cupin superfamily protein